MRAYDQKLIATVYWSLGTLVVIAVALIGFGWFANFKVYERDKAVLETKLTSQIQTQLSEHLRKAVDRLGKVVQDVAEAKVNKLEGRVSDVEYDIALVEADRWHEAGVHTNCLRVGKEIVELAMERGGWDWRISKGLEIMRRALTDGALPEADLAAEIIERLSSLPEAFRVDVQNIEDAMRRARA